MRGAFKAVIVTVVPLVTFTLGAAPATAADYNYSAEASAAAHAPQFETQSILTTDDASVNELTLTSLIEQGDIASIPHGFDVEATIALAEAEIGTSRATGWNQPGECIVSAQRWIHAGGGAWSGSGDPVSNYQGAVRLGMQHAQPGDIVQYEHVLYPTSWMPGVHTVLITEVHDDGTFTIIESNNPGGSGLVTKDESWLPAPPAGFQAVVWRF